MPNLSLDKINENVEYLLSGAVDFEFRTTSARELHTEDDFEKIGKWIKGAPRYFIQVYKDSGATIGEPLTPMSKEEYEACLARVAPYVKQAEIRGMD